MPCSDSSSSIAIRLDHEERLVSFDFAKITCGREIDAKTDYQKYCQGRSLTEILSLKFSQIVRDLNLQIDEERQFVVYLEWDALRTAIAEYLGIETDGIDRTRCKITSIAHDEKGIEIAEVILPPAQMPKILPCNLSNNN